MAQNFWKDKSGRYEIKKVTIETVDQAVFDYFNKKLDIHVDSERGRTKASVIFATGERWKLIRDKKGLRDEHGTLILPLVAIRRVEIDRTPGLGGMRQEVPSITITKKIHPKTSLFQNLIKKRKTNFPSEPKREPVQEVLTIPFPDFATIFYEIIIWTQYQTQMNEILEKIFYNYDHMDSFVMPVDYDGTLPKGNSYYFVGFRDGTLSSQSNVEEFTDQERIIKYQYTIKTPVYLMMDPKDETLRYGESETTAPLTQDSVQVYKTQTAVDINLKQEIVGSIEDLEELLG